MPSVSGSRWSTAGAVLSLGSLMALANPIVLATPASALDSITVQTDRAQVLKLPPRATTIVIGNPMIADVTVQKNGSMVVTGKSYGTTNLIAQDPNGAVIGESLIRVEAATDGVMVLQRGLERETYSCTPRCQPTLSLGDEQKRFDAIGAQTTARNGLAK